MKNLIHSYRNKKLEIEKRIIDFNNLKEKEYFNEFLFCLLTPQSNAQRCWEAVKEINKLKSLEKTNIAKILRKKTRFHNNKAKYVSNAEQTFALIKKELNKKNKIELRNWIEKNVKGYGLKEASHFLRNIGKSDNQIAILDRHILRNLVKLNVIKEDKIKNKKHYLELEQDFINFSKKIKIPIDHLDLLFWSQENGEIFK